MAETWIPITPDLCAASFGEVEWEAFVNAARSAGAEDQVPGKIRSIVNRVRGYLAANEDNAMGPAGTVPPELEDAALILIFQALCTSMPASGLAIDEPRQRRIDAANADLRAVGKGEFYIKAKDLVLLPHRRA